MAVTLQQVELKRLVTILSPKMTVDSHKDAIETLSRLMEPAPYGVYICDAKGNVVFANQVGRAFYADILKRSDSHEWVTLGEMFTTDGASVPPPQFPMSRALRGEIVPEMEYEICREGKSFRVDISAHPLQEGGRIIGAMSLHRYHDQRG
jgi:hypothetical protein